MVKLLKIYLDLIQNVVEFRPLFANTSFTSLRFVEKLQQDIPGKGVKQQLEVLCGIYSLYLLHKHQGDFLGTGYITSKQASLANDQLRALYSKVRLVKLVFSYSYVVELGLFSLIRSCVLSASSKCYIAG